MSRWLRRGLTCFVVGASWSTAGAQPAGHGVHPVMPDVKLFLHLRFLDADESRFSDVPLGVRSASVAETLDQSIESSLGAAIRARQYLPSAELEQKVTPCDTDAAPPAVELAIDGPSQSFRRWLLADDPERNRLISYIGTWRYMAVSDAKERDVLFHQFEGELTRSPMVRIRSSDGEKWQEAPLEAGRTQTIAELGCTILVREFFPDYAMDPTTLRPSNQSPRKKNPAALVEIEHKGVKEARWIFTKFPDFAPAEGKRLPFQLVLDCPIETDGGAPDLAIVTVARSQHESWVRVNGKTTANPLEVDTKIEVPGSQYGFKVVRFLAGARMVETYNPATHGKGEPAVEIEFPDQNGLASKLWLGLGHFRRITTPKGAALVGFDDRSGPPSSAHP